MGGYHIIKALIVFPAVFLVFYSIFRRINNDFIVISAIIRIINIDFSLSFKFSDLITYDSMVAVLIIAIPIKMYYRGSSVFYSLNQFFVLVLILFSLATCII